MGKSEDCGQMVYIGVCVWGGGGVGRGGRLREGSGGSLKPLLCPPFLNIL